MHGRAKRVVTPGWSVSSPGASDATMLSLSPMKMAAATSATTAPS
jgi:hypothetical protein